MTSYFSIHNNYDIGYFSRFKKIKDDEKRIYYLRTILRLFIILMFLIFILFLLVFRYKIDTIYKLTLTLIIILLLVIIYNISLYGYIYPNIDLINKEKELLNEEKKEIDRIYTSQSIRFYLLYNDQFKL